MGRYEGPRGQSMPADQPGLHWQWFRMRSDAPRQYPKWGGALVEVLNWLVFCIAAFFVLEDLRMGGLGTSNGRIVSFFDSLNSCDEFRKQHAWPERSGRWDCIIGTASPRRNSGQGVCPYRLCDANDARRNIWIFLSNFMAKFGMAALASVIIGETPVILKGPRHCVFFIAAFFVCHCAPDDYVHKQLGSCRSWKLLSGLAVSLYKLRKVLFVVEASSVGFVVTLIVAAISAEGSSFARRVINWWDTRGISSLSPRVLPRLAEEFLTGLIFAALRLTPLFVCVATLVPMYENYGSPHGPLHAQLPGLDSAQQVLGGGLRFLTLCVFLHRYRVIQQVFLSWDSAWLSPADWSDSLNCVRLLKGGKSLSQPCSVSSQRKKIE